MKTKTSLFVAAVVCTLAGTAWAQEGIGTRSSAGPTGWGAGAEAMLLGGPSGAALVYDMGDMHVDGILGLASGGGTQLGLGGRLLWVMHRSSAADFSLGGGLGLVHTDPDGNADSITDFHVEAIAQTSTTAGMIPLRLAGSF